MRDYVGLKFWYRGEYALMQHRKSLDNWISTIQSQIKINHKNKKVWVILENKGRCFEIAALFGQSIIKMAYWL